MELELLAGGLEGVASGVEMPLDTLLSDGASRGVELLPWNRGR